MGKRGNGHARRNAQLAVLAVIVGLVLVATLPSASLPSVGASSGAQAFSDGERATLDLEPGAIAWHAMIEYVFAPSRTDAPKASTEPVLAVVPAAAPTPTVAPSLTVAPSPTVAPAPQATPQPPPVPGHISRGQQALARVPVSPGSVGFTIEFLPGRAGYGGLTYPDTRRIEIYVDAGWSDGYLTHVVAHEIGHAVDMARNSRSDHERWRAARGIPATTRWWADPYTSDFATPGGDFAECFAAWAVGSTSTRSEFGSCTGTSALMGELVWG